MNWRWISLSALAGLAGIIAVVLRTVRRPDRGTRVPGSWPANVAHRGDSARAPENTLEAFRLGVEAGAGGLELDLWLTRDGEVVVIHDAAVDRTTDGTGAVAGMTLAEIQSLDAGYRFSPDGGLTFPYRGLGATVPTLARIYEEFPDHHVNADIKDARPEAVEAVWEVIRDAAAEDRTLIASIDHRVIRRFRRMCGGRVQTAASRPEIAAFYALSVTRLGSLSSPAYDALQVPVEHRGIELVTPRFIRAAHIRGVRVDVWTINDADEMVRLLNLGVDAVMTDRPRVLAGILERRPEAR